MPKKILIAAANHYNADLQVGSHHFARSFKKLGYQVLYISNPISPIHKFFANNNNFKQRENIHKSGGKKIGNITYYVPKSLFITPQNKFLLSLKFVIDYWHLFSKPNLLKYIKQQEFNKVDIIWFDSPMFGFLLNSINYKKSILRLADYSKGFSAVSKNQYLTEIEIANRVDKVIYSSVNLKNKYKEIHNKKKMQYVPNGIDYQFIANSDKSIPAEYRQFKGASIIVYVGYISEWFDDEIVYKAATTMQDCKFVLIGPVKKDLRKLKKLPNIFFLGSKPYSKIAQYLFNANAGIIPFDIKNHRQLIESVHPLKLYEYMATGLPVVSTNWDELKNINSPAYLAKSDQQFINLLRKAINENNNKLIYKNFAKKNDWSLRINNILKDL